MQDAVLQIMLLFNDFCSVTALLPLEFNELVCNLPYLEVNWLPSYSVSVEESPLNRREKIVQVFTSLKDILDVLVYSSILTAQKAILKQLNFG